MPRRNWVFLISGIAVLGAAFLVSRPARPPVDGRLASPAPGTSAVPDAARVPLPVLRFSRAAGTTRAYRVRYSSDGEVDLAFLRTSAQPAGARAPEESLPSSADALLEGTLLVRFLDAEEGTTPLALRILPDRALVNGREFDDADLLDRPFLARMDDRGDLRGFRFPAGIPPVVVGMCRTVAESMRAVLPEGGETEWSVDEEDLLGECVAAYRRGPPAAGGGTTIEKSRRSIAPGAREGPGPADVRIVVDSSRWTFEVDPGSGWLERAEGREEVRQTSRGRNFGKTRFEFTAFRIPVPPEASLPANAEEARRALEDRSLLRLEPRRTRVELNVVTLPWKTADAVEAFRRGFGPDFERARDLVVNYLRQEPERARALVDWLAAEGTSLPLDVELGLWRAVAVAGTPEAQAAFARALTDPSQGDLAPFRAVAHASDFLDPAPVLLEALWSVHRAEKSSRDPLRHALSSSALYDIGALGHASRLDPETGARIARDLEETLRSAASPAEREVALAAIGNHGGETLLPAVESSFASEDPDVRSEAFRALRRMEGPAPVETLLRHYAAEKSAGVRTDAMETLREMPGREAGLPFAREEVLRAGPDGARIALVHLIGETMATHEGGDAVLRAVLASGAPQAVRKAVYKYVKP